MPLETIPTNIASIRQVISLGPGNMESIPWILGEDSLEFKKRDN